MVNSLQKFYKFISTHLLTVLTIGGNVISEIEQRTFRAVYGIFLFTDNSICRIGKEEPL